MQENLVIIFIKEPKLGFVKTRIANSTSEKFALDLYIKMAKEIIMKLENNNFDLKLCIHGDIEYSTKIFGDYDNFSQTNDNLGIKMKNAFIEQFKNNYKKIVLIGSDIPDITVNIINESFNALNTHNMTIGPALDGGYYLIAFNKNDFNENVFENISWSTNKVLEQTLSLSSKNIFLHKYLNDIDTIDDLKASKYFTGVNYD